MYVGLGSSEIATNGICPEETGAARHRAGECGDGTRSRNACCALRWAGRHLHHPEQSELNRGRIFCNPLPSDTDRKRYSLRRTVLQKTYSPRFSDFALEFYSFVADNYAPFFSTPIECADRDAATVLDGLLYNESDLELEEHYTDTHGYTDINFAAFAMLGCRFSPRIRGLKKQRLYRVDTRDYGTLGSLVGRAVRKIDTRGIADQWDRLGHFDLSLLRHVSPIEWDNIILYGEYVLNRRLVRRSRSWP